MVIDTPVYVPLGFAHVHPHVFFDFLAYTIGARLYFWMRPKTDMTKRQSWAIAGGALAGAALGAVLLAVLMDPFHWKLGKTIVGGLLGGVAGVELTKIAVGYRRSTGDTFVFPLLAGMGVGRLGCFLSGLADNTTGIATGLPWGVDLGDGVPRHPTAIYEIVFLIVMGGFLIRRKRLPREPGDLFKIFMIAYLVFRLFIDFLKPYPRPFLGLGALQLAALAGLYYYAGDVRRLAGKPRASHA